MAKSLTFRERMALAASALSGRTPSKDSSVGRKLLSGVISPGGTPPVRGVKEYLTAYSTMPWLRAVASRVSYDVAATDWKIFVEKQGGKPVKNRVLQKSQGLRRKAMISAFMTDGTIEEITDHKLLDLLDDANPMQTGLQMRRVTQQHIDLVGEAFWLIERGKLNQPVAVWPIPPSWILGTPHPNRPFFRVSFRGWQGDIPESEIIWFSDIDPLNPYGRGTGTSQSLSDELETDEYASKHTKTFFYNSARPDLLVYPKNGGTMEEADVERLEEEWLSKNQGFWRAFKPFFLRREVEVEQIETGNFRAQQLIPLRQFERDTILQVFGVSPEILGILGPGSNRATVTIGEQVYARRVLIPRLEMIRSVVQERLAPMFDDRIVVDYESPVTKDRELELDAARVAPWAMTVNEWRERIGLDELDDEKGDVFMVPATLTPKKDISEEPPDPMTDPTLGGGNQDLAEDTDPADREIAETNDDAE